MKYYVVKYTGLFGFIKPWTAVRDEEVFSQQFLTPSIVGGIERKLFPELLDKPFNIYKIKSHRLSYSQIAIQQEQTQPRGWNDAGKTKERPFSILKRGVLINPILHLLFENKNDAEIAFQQHICLSRNEDILMPEEIFEIENVEFDTNEDLFYGFELVFEKNDKSFQVGYNRMNNNEPMFGWLKIVGTPVKSTF